jgi:hypothetical protein
MERRTFILTSGATALETQFAAGANERVNVAVVGTGKRGREHLEIIGGLSGVRVAAICDVDSAQVERAAARMDSRAKTYHDYRDLLADKSIDAVVLSTCNHWHALGTVWACRAGKDVYVEWPASHNLWEGRRMIDAAAKYGRIVQVGLLGRSMAHKQKAVELLREGALGTVCLAKAVSCQRRKPAGKLSGTEAPAGVDFDQWLGPAPPRAFHANRFTGTGAGSGIRATATPLMSWTSHGGDSARATYLSALLPQAVSTSTMMARKRRVINSRLSSMVIRRSCTNRTAWHRAWRVTFSTAAKVSSRSARQASSFMCAASCT